MKMRPGIAFSEHVRTEKIRHHRLDSSKDFNTRGFVLVFSLFLAVGVLLYRLFILQVVQGSYYRGLADSNRTRTQIVHAPRGVIFDRNLVPLVFNVPGFREIRGDRTVVYEQKEALEAIAEGKKTFEIDSLRNYPYRDLLSHVLGYTGQITKEQFEKDIYKSYLPSDWIGKSGIEESYESTLRGVDGRQLVEVDAMGEKVRILGKSDPIPGKDITLTVDIALQEAAYKALPQGKKGVVIVSNTKGEILAMVSKPSFDPNLFTMGQSYKATDSAYRDIEDILTDSDNQPLLNRAISGTYPPGSTFKLITAASGLEEGVIDESYTVEDTGVVRIGTYSFSNWYFTQYGGKDGIVDVVKAISRSNDIFFYKLADEIGVDKLSETAKLFGIGSVLGIDLAGEKAGVLPTKEWKQKEIGESWYTGDTFIYGIGQGYLLTTPLQVNAFTQAVANGGTLYRPHLLKNPASTAKRGEEESRIINQELLSGENQTLIREGMIQSCRPGGVAFPFYEFKVKNEKLKVDGKNILEAPQATTSANFQDFRHVVVACKTGTAQWGGEKDDPHAWITLFAPAYDPEIVVTVLAEASGEGSSVAGPIAREIVESYFEAKKE